MLPHGKRLTIKGDNTLVFAMIQYRCISPERVTLKYSLTFRYIGI